MAPASFPKSLNLDGEHKGKGTSLKPAHEPIVVARKPLVGTVAQNVERFGTGALNIAATRIQGTPRTTHADGNHQGTSPHPMDWGKATEDARDGAVGRWPANVVLSHLPECEEDACAESCAVAELDRQSGERPSSGGAAFDRGLFIDGGGLSPDTDRRELGYGDTGGASRYFATFPWKYQAKASRAERNAGLEGFEERESREWRTGNAPPNVEHRVPDKRAANGHPTVKPVELMRWLCRLVTPPDGTVLDPFAGSGTTGIACVLEDFDFIGIERESEYVEIAKARIDWWDTHKDRADEILALSAKSERGRQEHVEAGQIGLFEEAAPATKAGRSTYGLRTTKTIPRCPEHDSALPSGRNAYGCGCSIQYQAA